MSDANQHKVFDGALTVAVFSKPGRTAEAVDVIVVHLEADANEREAAEAVARGYTYCGSIAVKDGLPSVKCEPGGMALVAVAAGGIIFAGMLGPLVKQHQLEQRQSTDDALRA